MKWRAGFTACALVAGMAVAPAANAADPGQIVLRGDRSASATFRLEKEVRLECCGLEVRTINGETTFQLAGLNIRTSGTYAGFVIERTSDGRIVKAAVGVPALDLDEGRIPIAITFGRARSLSPGTYRFHLLTDGPSTVRLDLEGLGRQIVMRPSEASRAVGQVTTLAESTTDRTIQGRVPVEVSKSSMVFLGVKTEGDLTQAHYLSQCLTPAGGNCTDPQDHDAWASPASGGGSGTLERVYRAGTLEPGDHEAVFAAASAGVQEDAYGFVLVFR